MTVTLTSSLAAGVTRTLGDQSTSLSAALNSGSVANATDATSTTGTQSTSADAVQTSLVDQDQVSTLRINALNIAFIGTQLDTISTGATQVQDILGQLASLAAQAGSSALPNSQRIELDGEFQALAAALDQVPPQPPGSQYPSDTLLNALPTSSASTSGTTAGSSNSNVVLGGFSSNALLGGASTTNLLTPDSAQQASSTIAGAATSIANQRSVIGGLQDTVDFSAASVDGALQNQDAASSTLTPDDLSNQASLSLQASLQADSANAIAAQTSRLPANVLQLLA